MSDAYYNSPIPNFVNEAPEAILGKLTLRHHHELEHQQRNAWLKQIYILQDQLSGLLQGHLFFELIIPRMGKRADCVVVLSNIIFVIEFKVGSSTFDRHAIEQVHDYALDLKNFHLGSHDAHIVPILVATKAESVWAEISFATDCVADPLLIGSTEIGDTLSKVPKLSYGKPIDCGEWQTSGYQPTPTIIEAAQALYQKHDVEQISRSDAGAKNLQSTSRLIAEVIEKSKRDGRKSICFVTGVPGAGKTLAGLNIATSRAVGHEDEHAVFLSGNGPLVTVLREALARDQVARTGAKKADASREVRSFVQNIHHFRDEYLRDQSEPFEKVVVFDEAQRAWTREQASNFMQTKRGLTDFSQSEPEFLIGVMDRHKDWCTIVCLIGGGQEINTGEAGLLEWLSALKTSFPDWDIHASALLNDRHYTIEPKAVELLKEPKISLHSDLHLAVSMRSFRAEKLSSFVSQLLDNNSGEAAEILSELLPRYPIWVTRNLNEAKSWLLHAARGSERTGLIASSGAHRLRPEGIHIKSPIDTASWFLNDKSDVRSSYYLEDVATEFYVQGLEVDWAGVCWDCNLRNVDGHWKYCAFKGSKWQSINAKTRQLFLVNSYRVLLTRARQGMVIFVPDGDPNDPTRLPEFYNGTYQYLIDCGVPTKPVHIEPSVSFTPVSN